MDARIRDFQKKVLAFYVEQGRDLPWRRTADPYRILLSEVMLQQTQVDRVVGYYNRWTEKWPTIANLAGASLAEVLREWSGLGYNRRAINLHRTAQKIVQDFKGDVLAAMEHYKDLPGIGPYTASAVRIFAGNEDIVTVDTNIRRIMIHEFKLDEKTSDKELWELAQRCLPHGKSRDWHNALMDYGAINLTARKTGIKPKSQQSAFEGSDRQIRGRILKFVLATDGPVTHSALTSLADTQRDKVEIILKGMVRDGLVAEKGRKYTVPGKEE